MAEMPPVVHAILHPANGYLLETTADEVAANRYRNTYEGSQIVPYVPAGKLTALQAKLERYERMEAAMRKEHARLVEIQASGFLVEQQQGAFDAIEDFLSMLDAQEPTDANA